LDDHAFEGDAVEEAGILVPPVGPLGESQVHEGVAASVAQVAGAAGAKTSEGVALDAQRASNQPPRERKEAEEGGLDAKAIIEEFAKQSLICAVLQPTLGGDMQAIKDAARRADVVVIDWVIHKVPGDFTGNLVTEILKEDAARGGRLRLIAIYTIEPDLQKVLKLLRERLVTAELVSTQDTLLSFRSSAFRIVVLAKPGARIPEQTPERENIVEQHDLPARLHHEFACLARGVIRNVALRGLAVLRDNTHEILAYLGSDLDAAFVAHRVLLAAPDDAADHAVALLGSELTSMLHGFDVRSEASAERVQAWLNHQAKEYELAIDPKKPPRKLAPSGLEPLLRDGISSWKDPDLSKSARGRFFLHATQTFLPSAADRAKSADLADLRFAVATSSVHLYEKTSVRADESRSQNPQLKLGAIICNDTAEPRRYLVCLQPVCDSVRLDDESDTRFPFLGAELAKPGEPFELVVEDGPGNFQRLRPDAKLANIRLLAFRSKGRVVRATKRDTGFYFEGADGVYRWLGQLKEAQAQRVAHKFATDISRVGLDESEWLRLSRGGKD